MLKEDVIVVRFNLRCQLERTTEVATAMTVIVGPVRGGPGVLHFDMARDLTDPDALIATEVVPDRAAMAREEALPERVAALVALRHDGALTGASEWTIVDVASIESPTMSLHPEPGGAVSHQ